jgi:hypothetical protein
LSRESIFRVDIRVFESWKRFWYQAKEFACRGGATKDGKDVYVQTVL